MIPKRYHSALAPEENHPPMTRYVAPRVTAFVHDLFAGPLPSDFDATDLVYVEPPWPDGFAKFEERAGETHSPHRTYPQFMDRVVAAVRQMRPRPVVVLGGKRAARFFPEATSIVPIRINGGNAIAYCHDVAPASEWKTTHDALADLAGRFMVAGDFCCGYGVVARYFTTEGRRCVLSDFNAKCIGGVAAGAWR